MSVTKDLANRLTDKDFFGGGIPPVSQDISALEKFPVPQKIFLYFKTKLEMLSGLPPFPLDVSRGVAAGINQ